MNFKKLAFSLLFLSVVVVFSGCSSNKTKNTFSFSPENPVPKQEITITYNPSKTNLKDAKDIELIAYLYSKDLDRAKGITLKKSGNVWKGNISTDDTTRGIVIKFVSGDETDNNKQSGYVIKMYSKAKKLVPGANAGLALVNLKYGRAIGLETDKKGDYDLFEQEFKLNPNVKDEYLETYFYSVPKNHRDSVAKAELDNLEKKVNLSEKDIESLASLYGSLGNRQKYNKYKELAVKKYPNSKLVQNDEFTAFRMEKSLKAKTAKLNDFINKYPQSKLIPNMFYILIDDFSKKKEYTEAKNLIENHPKYADAEMYNSVAWSMYTSGDISPLATNLAAKSVELARNEVKNPKGKRPVYFTAKQWKEARENSLGYVLDTYGSLLRKSGKNEKALSACKEAVALTKEKQSDLNENYIECLLSSGYKEKAKKSLEKFVSSGNYNKKMKDELKSLFVELGGSKKELTSYMQKIEGAAKSKLVEKVKKELIESPAPKFTLSDLEGKSVSLGDFKGKTVILDFWATWCGPCKKSFPAMKMAVEKFKDNPNVIFLFVNTWERVNDKKKNAADFVEKNNYPFEVLLDKENKVVANYNVTGIPTKFIIDKNGNIRFKSVGFSGKDDELVEELSTVIALVK